MRISDWSSDVCSSDLRVEVIAHQLHILLIALVVGVTELRLLDLLATHLGNHRVTATAIERIDAPERKRDSQQGNDEPSHESGRDRKSVGEGKRVSVRVDLGGRGSIKKTKRKQQ